MLSLEGQQLGNYDVIRRIRVGGMGAVYEGRQRTAFDRRVAIKVILGDYAADRDMRRRFAREARTIARLHHPHILPLIEFGDADGILYLVMPFIDGGTLTSYLRRALPTLEEIAAIYLQLLDAVEHAHEEGLIHRDIKSSNVLMEEHRNGPPHIYLADFGLVRTKKQKVSSQAGKPIPLDQVPGTPHYMAPEQTRGIVTPLTDIYALGVLLYQMLTGELPYNDPDDVRVIQMHLRAPIPLPSERDASIPGELDDVVRTAMAKRRDARFQTIAELREAFLAAIKGPGIEVMEDAEDHDSVIIEQEAYSPSEEEVSVPRVLQRSVTPPEPLMLGGPSEADVLPRREPSTVIMRSTRKRDTGAIRQRPRITEEPTRLIRGNRPPNGWLIAAIVVPVLLLLLLFVTRIAGIGILPAGFPLLGGTPVATVDVVPKSKTLQDNYVLTASPQIKQANLTTHTIPAHLLRSNASDNTTVQTTGTKEVGGAQARGSITFSNAGNAPVAVATGMILTPPSGSVRIQIVQGVTVPPQQGGQDGQAIASAIAVDQGAAGNLAAHALDGTCCNGNLKMSNPTPFAGGVDAQTVHVVSQTDLDTARNTLVLRVQGQVMQQLQGMLQADEVIAGVPNYAIRTATSSPVGAQVDQVQVAVSIEGHAIVYNRALATNTAMQLLRTQAIQSLGSNYQAQGDPVAAPPKANPGPNGVIYVSVPVRGQWAYALSPNQVSQWRQSIKGATSAVALAYLRAQPGVASVQINLPFGTDHLPTAIDQINMVIGKQA